MKRYFTFQDEKSNKFWAVEVQNQEMTVIFGKTGTAGNTNTKTFPDETTAQLEAEKLIKEKTKKGYMESTGESAGEFGEAEFWGLIERSKGKSEDTDEQAAILTDILSKRSKEDIIAFGQIFRRYYVNSYQSDLWAAAFIINGGCSNDGFDYFRGWLIAQGKDVYMNALENPEYLTRVIHEDDLDYGVECEDMIYVSGKAYSLKTGEDENRFLELVPLLDYPEIDTNDIEDDLYLKGKFPKLWKKFSGE